VTGILLSTFWGLLVFLGGFKGAWVFFLVAMHIWDSGMVCWSGLALSDWQLQRGVLVGVERRGEGGGGCRVV
jgi:hypothetical protein